MINSQFVRQTLSIFALNEAVIMSENVKSHRVLPLMLVFLFVRLNKLIKAYGNVFVCIVDEFFHWVECGDGAVVPCTWTREITARCANYKQWMYILINGPSVLMISPNFTNGCGNENHRSMVSIIYITVYVSLAWNEPLGTSNTSWDGFSARNSS